MSSTIRAVVLDGPASPEALRIGHLRSRSRRPGWELIKVKAFVLSRSELHTGCPVAAPSWAN